MNATFENQLSREEINRGVKAYIVRKLWLPLLVWMAVLFLLLHLLMRASLTVALLVAALGAAGTAVWIFVVQRRQFHPDKTATYHLERKHLVIAAGNGSVSRCGWNEVRVVDCGTVILLCLSKQRFAIVSKRCLGPGQEAFLLTHKK